jgi:hypothetical protein
VTEASAQIIAQNAKILSRRWTKLRHHSEQQRLLNSTARFRTVPAGRRSGKTEIAKRVIVKSALRGTTFDDPRFFCAAPTRDQAKRIYWNDLKALVPAEAQSKRPSETELTIYIRNGAEISVVGMDKPQRIEGSPWDGGILDEFGNMKEEAWAQNVRPALSDRLGWCWLIGVPEGRNHYYERDKEAQADSTGEWDSFHWKSADILPASEIASAKRDLDELTYLQEYEASFINFSGRAYYSFEDRLHSKYFLPYDKRAPLIFCLDFNVAPGVAVIAQEMQRADPETGALSMLIGDTMTGCIGEIYVERNSNTQIVCNKFIADFGKHEGPIHVYGDATGGAKGTAKLLGTDWEIVRNILYAHFKPERTWFYVPKANPPERSRVNSMNSRLRSMAGVVRLMVDPQKCPKLIRDLDGVQLIEGGSGEIDKKKDEKLTHLTDGLGYYVARMFPVRKVEAGVQEVGGL